MAPRPQVGDQPVNVRFPRDLHQQLIDRAAAEDRTLAATIREACRRYLAADPSEHRAQQGDE